MANLKSHSYSYGQTAMVFNVSHKENHNNIAQEIFMPSGPFAILPLKDGYSSAIVWTEKSELAEIYLKMSKKEFQLHLSEKFMEYFGKSEVISEVFAYPLSVKFSNEYFKGRLCLLGDSAHSMHPIAGQGFNQTIRDINSLADLLKYHFNLGLDLGSKMLLEDYQTERRFDNHAMIAITDVLNKLFSNNILPLSVTRKLGLAAVNKLPGLQKFFMKYAMGERG